MGEIFDFVVNSIVFDCLCIVVRLNFFFIIGEIFISASTSSA